MCEAVLHDMVLNTPSSQQAQQFFTQLAKRRFTGEQNFKRVLVPSSDKSSNCDECVLEGAVFFLHHIFIQLWLDVIA